MSLPDDEHTVTRLPGGGWVCKCGERGGTIAPDPEDHYELASLFDDDE